MPCPLKCARHISPRFRSDNESCLLKWSIPHACILFTLPTPTSEILDRACWSMSTYFIYFPMLIDRGIDLFFCTFLYFLTIIIIVHFGFHVLQFLLSHTAFRNVIFLIRNYGGIFITLLVFFQM